MTVDQQIQLASLIANTVMAAVAVASLRQTTKLVRDESRIRRKERNQAAWNNARLVVLSVGLVRNKSPHPIFAVTVTTDEENVPPAECKSLPSGETFETRLKLRKSIELREDGFRDVGVYVHNLAFTDHEGRRWTRTEEGNLLVDESGMLP